MRRVLVIGSGGAGKTTFARALAARTGLPLVHLDAHYWRPGWVETPDAEWRAAVAVLLAGDSWIMDGNYNGTFDLRAAACDTVIFLDRPRLLCLWRVVMRWLRYSGASRPDISDGCPERLTVEFLRWIWNFPRKRRPTILARLAALPPEKNVVILRAAPEVDAFLASATDAR